MKPLPLNAYTLTNCLGAGLRATRAALHACASGLGAQRFETAALETWIGEIAGLDARRVPRELAAYDCRNQRAADLALAQDGFAEAVARARERYGAQRIGVFVGTSTGGILETELAYRRRGDGGALPADFEYRGAHSLSSTAEYVRARLGLEGPCAASSTACSSSAKVFATAARLLRAGFIDAAVVGGVDTLCLTTLYGFHSLQLLSSAPCRPYDAARDGISIGEGAAFALLARDAEAPDGIDLLGCGESCDAHHMSAPHPEGLGASLAMRRALDEARLAAAELGYVNLHGTGTQANDAAEDRAVLGLFGDRVPCSSTKGMTGHTLGAAGAVEAVITALALADGLVPGSPGTREVDPGLGARYELAPRAAPLGVAMSNSFGFGGSNCALVFGRRGR